MGQRLLVCFSSRHPNKFVANRLDETHFKCRGTQTHWWRARTTTVHRKMETRRLKFLGHIVRNWSIDHFVITRMIPGKRAVRGQRQTYTLQSLTKWSPTQGVHQARLQIVFSFLSCSLSAELADLEWLGLARHIASCLVSNLLIARWEFAVKQLSHTGTRSL